MPTGYGKVYSSEEILESKEERDEVSLIFNYFDQDGDGSIERDELKRVLQELDKDLWTDGKVDAMLGDYDKDGDGKFQFPEFWGWICGHGGRSTDSFKPALLERAATEERASLARNQQLVEKRLARERRASEAAVKEEERLLGRRQSRKDFVSDHVALGMTKEAANDLYRKADVDNDGDVDVDELQWMAGDNLATVGDIKGVFQQSCQPGGGPIAVADCEDECLHALVTAFSSWDLDGDGIISCDEIALVLQKLNPKLTQLTVDIMMKEMDTLKDGHIDIIEFSSWLSGNNTRKKQLKKKARQLRDAKIACGLHRKRAEEAKELSRQQEFEEHQHKAAEKWCEKQKIKPACITLVGGPHPRKLCTQCHERHVWLCHGCGFVSFYDECVHGCPFGQYGWSCLSGQCRKKCGCKRDPEYWQRMGGVTSVSELSLSLENILKASTDAEQAPE